MSGHSKQLYITKSPFHIVVCRFTFVVSLNVTGFVYYVVLPADASLPTIVDSQALTTQNASAVLNGAAITASGTVIVSTAFTNYSQLVLVCKLYQSASSRTGLHGV